MARPARGAWTALRRRRTNEVIVRQMDFSSGANARLAFRMVFLSRLPPGVCASSAIAAQSISAWATVRSTSAPLRQGTARKLRRLPNGKGDKAERRRRIEIFLHMMEEQKEYVCFEPETFMLMVDKVITQRDGCMEFCFRNGIKCKYPQ